MPELLPPMLLATIAILAGFAGLIWSADRFVAGSAAIAKSLGAAPLIIGLTIVSFGTSAPEVMVSLNASFKGEGGLAIGNALGSNIANMGLVLGITTLLAAIPVQRHLLSQEIPVLLIASLVGGVFLFDNQLQRWEGVTLLLILLPAIGFLIVVKRKSPASAEVSAEGEVDNLGTRPAILWFCIGLIALIISSDILVWGAKTYAEFFGVSSLIIGLTVIAVGTSLPELAASAISALKGHHDIALGNIVGSNMFNLLAVMSIPGAVAPLALESQVFERDFFTMFAITLLLCGLVIIALRSKQPQKRRLGKVSGVLLLSCYIAYYIKLFIDT
ncbi:MAG: calcium/sodium antiporter [Cellvibrionaceae bacterium]|nr:calcium/sodium antiporter [Cellvibrionaceae bacterium]